MIHQPPAGARDLLPLDVAQKIWIERRLQQVFHSWGYHRIITSTLERLDTLMAGGAIQRSTVIQLQDAENEGLGLRPELTASIARAAISRMGGTDGWPQRLYYNANIFRKGGQTGHGTQLEFYQAGVELLGAAGVRADLEILLLLGDCLRSLNLQNPQFILGEAGLTRSLLSPFPEPLRHQVRQAIANLDRITLETLPLSPELQQRALFLLDLRGRPEDVLTKVSQLDLDNSQREALNNLKSLIDGLNQYQQLQPDQPSPMSLTLDLSLIQTFDYYTGIVFIVVSDSHSGSRILGQGGRYDQLLGLYHPLGETKPSIGFSLTIEELHQVLLEMGQLPANIPSSDCLVVAKTPQAEAAAFAFAEHLRQSEGAQVQMELSGSDDSEALRKYARRRGIAQIAWVDTQGSPTLEVI